jgi:putative ABC transport system ATP-binding protein
MARPTAGRLEVAGREVGRLPERFLTEVRRSTFGFIFQQFHLLPQVSVLENVLLPLYPLPVGLPEMRRRAGALLERFGLSGKRAVRAGHLSGGEQQRVAVARALVNAPRILIADEPTAHLDRQHAGELLGLLGELNGEGMTIVIATHDPFVCEHPLVTRTFEMRDGRIERESGR